MSPQASKPPLQAAPRRSSRLRSRETAGAGQQSCNKPKSNFLGLSIEVRILIFSHIIVTERPFLIGRCQEERRKINGSPRDIFSMHKSKFKPRRNERRNRPIQPPITRVCRTFREEALPLWYSENSFWLIHNEFTTDKEGALHAWHSENPQDNSANEVTKPKRAFDAWIAQTPQDMFNLMQHVSLCGYAGWPNRMMISIDLKNRQVTDTKHYSTFGDEMPIYPSLQALIESTKQALATKTDGLIALKAILLESDSLFEIPQFCYDSPPGMKTGVEPAHGWEYDW